MTQDEYLNNKIPPNAQKANDIGANLAEAVIIVLAEKELQQNNQVSMIATDDKLALITATRRKIRGIFALKMMEDAGLNKHEIKAIVNSEEHQTKFLTEIALLKAARDQKPDNPVIQP